MFSVQPQISAEVQLVGAPRHTETTLTCTAEVRWWLKEFDEVGFNIGDGDDEDDGRDDNGDGFQIQAWPKPINYWTFGTGEMIVANDKFVVQENELNGYKFQLVLVIKKLEKVQEIV